MKKFLPLFFVFLPFMAKAQVPAGWSKNVTQIAHPQKQIATKDGGFLIWGSRDDHFYIKYSTEGQLLWAQPNKSPSEIVSRITTALSEKNNGNLWLSGSGISMTDPAISYIQELTPLTGDTLFTKYIPDSLNLQELRFDGTDHKIYGSSLRNAEVIDGSYNAVVEYDENLNYIRDLATIWGDFHFPNIVSDDLYVNTSYPDYVYMSLFVNKPAAYVLGDSYPDNQGIHDYHIVGKFPSGDLLLFGLGKIATYQKGSSTLTPFLDSFFGLNDKETIDGALASASGDFIVHGTHESSPNVLLPFLLKVDVTGNQIWKHYYPQETNYKLHSMVNAQDGGVAMLVHQGGQVKLVKANVQGHILQAKDEITGAMAPIGIFPNPVTSNHLHLTFPKPYSGTLQVVDQTGKRWMERDLAPTNNLHLVLPEGMPAGIYHLRLSDDKGITQTLRLVKQ